MRFASSEVIDLLLDNKKSLKAGNPHHSATCLACKSPDIQHLFEKSFFPHWECARCGFIFVNPRLEEAELVQMYRSLAYFSNRTELFEIPRIRDGLSFNVTMNVDGWYGAIADRIRKHVTSGAMLDVGGGSGRFLKFVKDHHPEFDLTLAEVNESLCKVAREAFGLRTFNGAIEQLKLEGRKFDVVVSIATIEHIFDPASYLASIHSVLNKGGIVYMTMPRLGRLSRTVSTSAAYDVAPPLHLNFFDLRSMKALIETNRIPFSISDSLQSHGPVFHFGHLFCKHNYLIEDLFVEEIYEMPSRVYPHRDNSRLTSTVCRILDRLTAALTSVIQLIDGQRVAHFVLRAN